MTKVAILPVPDEKGAITYRALAGERNGQGRTAGEALDALTSQLPEEESGPVVILVGRKPDAYFSESQRKRLAELMDQWRTCRDAGGQLSAADQSELDALVEAELLASATRASAIADELVK